MILTIFLQAGKRIDSSFCFHQAQLQFLIHIKVLFIHVIDKNKYWWFNILIIFFYLTGVLKPCFTSYTRLILCSKIAERNLNIVNTLFMKHRLRLLLGTVNRQNGATEASGAAISFFIIYLISVLYRTKY